MERASIGDSTASLSQALKGPKKEDAEVSKLCDDVSIRQVATCRELRTNHSLTCSKLNPQDGGHHQ